MNAGNANLLNSLALIGLGFWLFQDTEKAIVVAPILFGMMLMVMSQGVRAESVSLSKVCSVITTAALGTSIYILFYFLPKGNYEVIGKVSLMILLNTLTLLMFFRFFTSRKARKKLIAERQQK